MYLLFVSQINGRDRATVFVSPPPDVDWPQVADPTTQTSARIEDVDWAVLEVGEEAAVKAAGKRPAASKRRQAIFTLSDDDAEEGEDADLFRLVPRKRRRQRPGLLVSGRRPASVVRPFLHCQMMK